MLSEILTSESFWFWTLVVVQSLLIIWFVETGNAVAAAVTLGTLVIGLAFFPTQWPHIGLGDLASMSFFEWLSTNLWPLIAGIGCYLLVGLGWATFRWWLYVRELRDNYERCKADWLAPGNLRSTANMLNSRAQLCHEISERERLTQWADACRMAATEGGNRLTHELKPVWKDFVTNGFRL